MRAWRLARPVALPLPMPSHGGFGHLAGAGVDVDARSVHTMTEGQHLLGDDEYGLLDEDPDAPSYLGPSPPRQRGCWPCKGRSAVAPGQAAAPPAPRGLNARMFWLLSRPPVLLVYLCLLALLNYYDRGAFVGILPILQAEFNLDNASAGIIGGAFIGAGGLPWPPTPAANTRLTASCPPDAAPFPPPWSATVGYSLVSPFMAQASRYVASGPLLMVGMVAWVIATGLCTFANGFWYLVVRACAARAGSLPGACPAEPPRTTRGVRGGGHPTQVMRCLTGIGEAAFICLAPALIDDVAPPTQRTRWLAVFFSMLPIGYAFGYLGAGLIAAYSRWEVVFLSESLLALPLACACIFLPTVKASKTAGHAHGPSTKPTIHERIAENVAAEEAVEAVPPKSFGMTLKALSRNPTYMLLTLGYCAQTFVIGALTFWVTRARARAPARRPRWAGCAAGCSHAPLCAPPGPRLRAVTAASVRGDGVRHGPVVGQLHHRQRHRRVGHRRQRAVVLHPGLLCGPAPCGTRRQDQAAVSPPGGPRLTAAKALANVCKRRA